MEEVSYGASDIQHIQGIPSQIYMCLGQRSSSESTLLF
jgi:hypothetical protein